MALYSYKARTPDGRVIDGQIDADNESGLANKLRSQKLTLVSSTKQGGLKYIFQTGPKVKTVEVSIFSRQFSTMIAAGLPVLQALNIQVEQTENKVFKQVLAKVRDDIGSGGNLSDSMAKFPSIFNPLYCNMIKAGELSGALDQILDRLSTYLEKSEALKSKVKGAMTYPVTILIFMGAIVALLFVKVIPSFKATFEGFGAKLPALTQALVDISAFETKYLVFQVVAVVGVVIVFNILRRTDKAGFIIDKYMLMLPIFGPLIKKQTVARFARTLGTLLKSGVQILDGLETVARSAGNRVIEKALLDTRSAVREGQSLMEPLKSTKLFPTMVIQMVSVGEETGKLDDMLLRMADFYDEEVDVAVDALMSMIEPLIMAVLGVVAGALVIGMYLPMFNMGGLVGG